jgi:hypothetical protein
MKWTVRPWKIVVLVRVGEDRAFSDLVLAGFDALRGTYNTGALFRAFSFFIFLFLHYPGLN